MKPEEKEFLKPRGKWETAMNLSIKRGEIYFAQLNPVMGSEQGGIRPVLIVQNDVGNQFSPTTIVLAITGRINKAKMPTHVELKASAYGLDRDSVILAEQIRTIDKIRLKQKVATLDAEMMGKVDHALMISLAMQEL